MNNLSSFQTLRLVGVVSTAFILNACASIHTPYSGLKEREIKALSSSDQQALLDGRGMSMALAAELNGYPGPMHVLENANQLNLNAQQRRDTENLMLAHKERVRALGYQLIEQECLLDQAFISRTIHAQSLQEFTDRIGQLQARIRADHLQTHLLQTALLDSSQIKQYQILRGYTNQ